MTVRIYNRCNLRSLGDGSTAGYNTIIFVGLIKTDALPRYCVNISCSIGKKNLPLCQCIFNLCQMPASDYPGVYKLSVVKSRLIKHFIISEFWLRLFVVIIFIAVSCL